MTITVPSPVGPTGRAPDELGKAIRRAGNRRERAGRSGADRPARSHALPPAMQILPRDDPTIEPTPVVQSKGR